MGVGVGVFINGHSTVTKDLIIVLSDLRVVQL